MAKTYRLDIRYIPETGINALRRVERLTDSLESDGYSVTDLSAFDDGMRVSLFASTEAEGRAELKLLALVSATGSIGRFSCREADQDAVEAASAEETALV